MQHQPGFKAVPGHPYASYRVYRDPYGRVFIEARCTICGPAGNWKTQCMRPDRQQQRVLKYATMHGHGFRPRGGT